MKSKADVLIGPGDDCAMTRASRHPALLTIDSLVEGTHFERTWLSAHQLGRKSFLINASDIAAMGGTPRYALVAISAPSNLATRALEHLQDGIVAAAAEHGTAIVGGNLTRARALSVTIALVGDAIHTVVRRDSAKPGDSIYVSGRLGDAALAVHWLSSGQTGARPRAALQRFAEPLPRLHAGQLLAKHGIASAMIDVSDGLVQDLGHVCESSRCAAVVHVARVPCSRQVARRRQYALSGGEDYELLFTVPRAKERQLQRIHPQLGCDITRIGEITRRSSTQAVLLLQDDGSTMHLEAGGFDHFRN